MEWVTTTAKTLPEAIDLALDNLGVDEAEAEIVVLEEPSKGLFGRMRGSARVEARVKPRTIRPKNDRGRSRRSRNDSRGRGKGRGRGQNSDGNRSGNRNDQDSGRKNSGSRSGTGGRNGRGRGNDQGGPSSESSQSGGSKSGSGRSNSKGGGQGGRRNGGRSKNDDQNANVEEKALTAAAVDSGSDQGSRSDSGGRSKSGGRGEGGNGGRRRRNNKPNNGNKSGNSGNNNKQDTKPQAKEEAPVEEVAEHLTTFLGGLTEAFGLEGDVDIDNSEADVLVATVQGQHGLMVGPKGRTLDAIQELARVSSQRAAPSNIRIRVDVGGYRPQRAAALGEFASKAADKAVDNASEVALEPMSPADRKAVHDSLVEDPRVETRSVGTEPRRRVIVIPVEDASSGSDEEE